MMSAPKTFKTLTKLTVTYGVFKSMYVEYHSSTAKKGNKNQHEEISMIYLNTIIQFTMTTATMQLVYLKRPSKNLMRGQIHVSSFNTNHIKFAITYKGKF